MSDYASSGDRARAHDEFRPPERYRGEARDSALMLLRLGHQPGEVLEALRKNFPRDLNLAVIVSAAAARVAYEKGEVDGSTK